MTTTPDNRKPWEHELRVRIAKVQHIEEEGVREHLLLEAYCTCGEYTVPYDPDIEALDVATRATDHMQQHPAKPLSIVQLGDDTMVLVMAVPGPVEDQPVHMTIAVTHEIFNDSKRLAAHLGSIGSAMHFRVQHQAEALLSGSMTLQGPPQLIGRFHGTSENVADFARGIQEMFERMRTDPTIPGVVLFGEQPESMPNIEGFRNEQPAPDIEIPDEIPDFE